MKVLHIIPSISPRRGGPSTAVIEMVKALREVSVDAEILTTNDDGPDQDLNIQMGAWIKYRDIPVLAFPRWRPPLRFAREYAFSPKLSHWLENHINDYDLLHVHALFSYPSTSSMAQARIHHIPYIVRSIGQLSPWSLAQSSGRKKLMMRVIERKNINGAAAIHFTTNVERDEAASLGFSSKPVVIPLGVNIPAKLSTKFVKHGQPTQFLFLSRIHPKKQLDRLLDALAIVMSKSPDYQWQLRIAGSCEPSYLSQLQGQASRLGIKDRCSWLGFLEGEEKWEELEKADWFILPSASENFGIAVVEALAAGTPVIITPQVAVAELIKQASAGIVSESEPQKLAKALCNALNFSTEAMGFAAKNLAQTNFSWERIATTVHDTYAEAIRQHSLS